MASPIDKPDFKFWADFVTNPDIEKWRVAMFLSDLYEQGYHVGLIYGWGIEQDKDLPDPFELL